MIALSAQAKTGFRVDIEIPLRNNKKELVGWTFIEYTSFRDPVTREMADSLATHLKRNKTAGRIVANASGEVVEQWQRPAA